MVDPSLDHVEIQHALRLEPLPRLDGVLLPVAREKHDRVVRVVEEIADQTGVVRGIQVDPLRSGEMEQVVVRLAAHLQDPDEQGEVAAQVDDLGGVDEDLAAGELAVTAPRNPRSSDPRRSAVPSG